MGNGNTGLKNQFGVGDPKTPGAPNTPNTPNTPDTGSDKQAQDFKAAFEKEQGVINGHLQYTAVNAEASRHDPLAARRDAMYPSFQAALGKIDRSDPSKAQGDIDKVLGEVRALSGEVASFRQEAEKAKNDWDARQGKYDEAVHQVEELEAWEDTKAPALRGLVDGIRTQVNERKYAQATTTFDQLQPKLEPIYAEYLKQKEAKAQYDPGLLALQPRLSAVASSARVKLAAERDAVGTAQTEMESSAQAKNYVKAFEQLGQLATKVEAFELAIEELERQKKAYEDALVVVQPKLTQVEQSTFKKLEPKQQEIATAKASIEAAAQSEDYEQALTLTNDLSTKCDEYIAAVTELEQQRKAYEEAWAALQPRFDQTTQSQFKKLELLQQELVTIKGQIDTAVQGEDFEQALTQVNDLSAKVDTFLADQEKAQQQRKAYEDAWASVGPKFTEALQSDAVKLAPQRDELTALKQQIDSAVEAEDFEQALTLTTDLGTKADACLEALRVLEEQKLKYELALSSLQPELDEVAKSPSKSLQPMRDEIATIKGEMETAAAAQEFEKAQQHAEDLKSKVGTYKQELSKEQEEYTQQLERVEAGVQEVSASTFGQLEAEKAAILSAYQAMIQLGEAEDYKAATAAGRALEVPVTDFVVEVKKLRKSIKENIKARLPQIDADMKEIAGDRSPKMGQINSLLASVKAAAGGQDDAVLEKAAKDLEELSQLVDQVKNDPCGKARRSDEYKLAKDDQRIAGADEVVAGVALRNAIAMAKTGGASMTAPPDPVKAAQLTWDVEKAEAAWKVAYLKSQKAGHAVNVVLKKFGCNEFEFELPNP